MISSGARTILSVKSRETLLAMLISAILLLAISYSSSQCYSIATSTTLPISEQNIDYYIRLINEFDFKAVKEHVKFLSTLKTRVTGYEDFYTAASYIESKLREYGLNVTLHYFNVTVPIDYGATIRIREHPDLKLRIYSLEPNFVVPNIANNLSGPLIYVGDGSFEEIEGKNLNGSIVLMEFNSHGMEKLLRSFGVKSIIYIEPVETTADEIKQKRYRLPIYFPRYLMPREDAMKLLTLLERGEKLHAVLNSYMKWEVKQGVNIIGSITGTKYPDAVKILCTYFDSYSITPLHAPGANEATSVGILLELARLMMKHKPMYTVYFIFFSGHYQGIAGAREFVEEVYWGRVMPPVNLPGQEFDKSNFLNITMVLEIALTTRSSEWAITNIGDLNGHVTSPQTPITYGNVYLYDYITLLAEKIGERLGKSYSILNAHTIPGAAAVGTAAQALVAISPAMRVMNRGFLPFDFEPFAYDGIALSIGFFTVDPMHHGLSPIDTFDKLNWDNLRTQVESLLPIVYSLIATDDFTNYLISIGRYTAPSKPVHVYRRGSTLTGRVAIYDKKIAWYRPISNALVVIYHMDTFGASWQTIDKIVTLTDSNGRFEFHHMMGGGMSDSYNLYAFKLDEKTGRILYAFDMGRYAYAQLKSYWVRKFYEDVGFITVFRAASVVIYDFVDPETASIANIARGIEVLDAISDSPAESFGYMIDEDQAVVFIPVEYSVKILLKAAHLGRIPLGVLLNATSENPTGYGYRLEPGEQLDVFYTPINIAKDFLHLVENYYAELSTYGIECVSQEEIKSSWDMLRKILVEYRRGDYSNAYLDSIRLWRRALKLYSTLISTKNDVVGTVPVFALMLIAFVPLFQQLVAPSAGKRRIVLLIVIFAIFIVLLYLAHPGFKLASNALMTVIGALMSVTILPSFAILYSALTWSIKVLTRRIRGAHEMERATASVIGLSFSMGIENLRKYKVRTLLVMLTVIPIVMSNVMLSSLTFVEVIHYTEIPRTPPYNGVLIRQKEWVLPLNGYFVKALVHILEKKGLTVAPRTALYTIAPALPPELRINYWISRDGKTYDVYAMAGIHPDALPKEIINRIMITGRWFREDDRWSCVLTLRQAKALSIEELPATLYFLGKQFKVIGIINATEFNKFLDINSEQITPWDARIPEQDFVHASADDVFIVDYYSSLYFNPTYTAITIRVITPEEATKLGEELASIFSRLNIWIGASNKTYILTLTRRIAGGGTTAMQVIPIVIAALILLNVMLGALYERRRDVFVVSTVGASPREVIVMFLAESLTYAIISGLIGYLSASYLMRYASHVLALPINYASGAVLGAIGVAVLVVVCSALYPIRWVVHLVTPSLRRRWEVPTRPKGDVWEIPLPFRYPTLREVKGVCAYLLEFLRAHEGEGLPIFTATSIRLESYDEGMRISFTSRIAPYELGVSQDVELLFARSKEAVEWTTTVRLIRRTGPRDAWERLNYTFIDEIRKQLLLWRSLSPEEKGKYAESLK